MPIYEYECLRCGNTFEIMQKFNEKLLDTCPTCSGKLQKLISNCTFQLKGSGWYLTDYAKKDKKEEKKEDKGDKLTEKSESTSSQEKITPPKAINE